MRDYKQEVREAETLVLLDARRYARLRVFGQIEDNSGGLIQISPGEKDRMIDFLTERMQQSAEYYLSMLALAGETLPR